MGRSKTFLRVLLPGVALVSLAACAGSGGGTGSPNAGTSASGLVPAAQFLDHMSDGKKQKRLKGLYVASYGGNNVDIYSEKAGGGVIGSLTGSFNDPQGIYINSSGTVYVGDTNNDRILVYANGSTTATQTLSDNGLPREITGDSNGTIYAGNVLQGNIAVYAAGATSPTSYLTVPNAATVLGVAVDANNDLYVSYDTQAGGYGSGQVDEFPAGSTTPTNLGITLVSASGLAIDAKQNLIVCDSADSDPSLAAVYVFAPGSTKPSLTLSLPNAYPIGVALSPNGKTLFVGEADKTQVQSFTYPKLKLHETIPTSGGYPNSIALYPPAVP
jgi:sugar lactone lactonase YvrE